MNRTIHCPAGGSVYMCMYSRRLTRKQTNMMQHKLQPSGNMAKADVSITATLPFHNKQPTVISHCDVLLQ